MTRPGFSYLARESVPNTLVPGRDPHLTELRHLRELVADAQRRRLRPSGIGPFLSPRALALTGLPYVEPEPTVHADQIGLLG